MGKYTLVLDSSQISSFLECQQLWYYKYVKLYIPSYLETESDDKSLAMNAGTYGHKLLDIYYQERSKGETLNEAAARAFSYNPDTDTCECGCSAASHKYLEAFKITECQRCKKCLQFRPKPFRLDQGTRMAVQNRLREYFFTYQNNDFKVEDPKQVEVGFSEVIYEDSDNLFVLEGRIDLLATLQGLECVVDHKFQMRKHQLYPKSVQFRNYALISKKLLFIVNYIRLAKTVDKETLSRVLVNFTGPELLAWKKKLIDIFFRIRRAKELGDSGGQPEQNFGACPGRFNYACNFTQLCEEPQEEVKLLKESQLYVINPNPWRPW